MYLFIIHKQERVGSVRSRKCSCTVLLHIKIHKQEMDLNMYTVKYVNMYMFMYIVIYVNMNITI
jgi:hypothetical protein